MKRINKINKSYDIEKISYELYISQKYQDKSSSENLKNLIKKYLSDRQLRFLYLYYIENSTMKCISESFDLSESTVSREIKKAKSIIKEKLKI